MNSGFNNQPKTSFMIRKLIRFVRSVLKVHYKYNDLLFNKMLKLLNKIFFLNLGFQVKFEYCLRLIFQEVIFFDIFLEQYQ